MYGFLNKTFNRIFLLCILSIIITIAYYLFFSNDLNINALLLVKNETTASTIAKNELIITFRTIQTLQQTTSDTTTTTTSSAPTTQVTIKNTTDSTTTTTEKPFNKKVDYTTFDEYVDDFCPANTLKNAYDCLKKLQKINIDNFQIDYNQTGLIYHHTYWRIHDSNSYHVRVLMLQILSYLATQDLNNTKFIIWITSSFPQPVVDLLHKKFGYYFNSTNIEIKSLDLKSLCSNGAFKVKYDACVGANEGNPVSFSDFVRFVVLYSYGGIYTDGDVFYLRNMKPFWTKNFVHRWSFLEDYNTAIMGFMKIRSETVEKIYGQIINNSLDLVGGFHPFGVKHAVSHLNGGKIYKFNEFNAYHSAFFDPAWLCNDGVMPRLNDKTPCGFREFYDTNVTADEFDFNKYYGGAFTYHLHLGNCGACQITETTFFYHFEVYFSSKIPYLGKNLS